MPFLALVLVDGCDSVYEKVVYQSELGHLHMHEWDFLNSFFGAWKMKNKSFSHGTVKLDVHGDLMEVQIFSSIS